MSRTVIVGSSVSGTRTAEYLRVEGYEGEIILIGDDVETPYDKPPLSKQILAGTMTEAENSLLTREAADAAGIDLRLGVRAEALDTSTRRVFLSGRREISYDTLVIATGTRARPSPWGQPEGVHLLRTIEDARILRRDILAGGHLVVIGGGFIGAEVAGTARKLGMTVEIVDPVAIPMGRVLGPEIGAVLSGLHARHDVQTRFGTGVTGISVDHSRTAPSGRPALTVELDDGAVLAADTVLVGIGAVTNHEWLEGSGLRLENGVVCDQFSRAAGVPGVYAAGDIARWWHPRHGEYVRVEHWTTATEHAQCVAYNITHSDDPRPFSPVEYIWSDQYDWRIQIAGRTGAATHLTIPNPLNDDRFAVLYADDGVHYSGAMTANWPKALVACRRAVSTGVTIEDLRETLEASLTRSSPGVAEAAQA